MIGGKKRYVVVILTAQYTEKSNESSPAKT